MGVEIVNFERARQELTAVLGSGVFGPSSRQAKLLEYLFEKVAEDRTGDLKEYTIAVELFQKPADFDQHSDATVRVEAHRLRKKLQKYYETAGKDHDFRILLPAGQYILEFQQAVPEIVEAATPTEPETPALARPMLGSRLLTIWGACATALCVCLGILVYSGVQHGATAAMPVARSAPAGMPDPDPGAVRILSGRAGELFVDGAGRRWKQDQFYQGGSTRNVASGVPARTGHPELFRTTREGTFRYRIPLSPGEYELRLYFTDPDGPDAERSPERRFRIMTVSANGRPLLDGYDMRVEAGCAADVRAFAHLRPNSQGVLDLEFYSARGPAAVSALEIIPTPGGAVRPVRIVAQPQPFLDNQGRLWLPDDYFFGGAFGGYPAMISGGIDPGIFLGERIGQFEYFIPVPQGEYQVSLYLGEGWYGPDESGRGGPGSRVFDVLVNYEKVLSNFDMLREGAPKKLITRTFRHVRPDTSGKVHLTFAPEVNFASVRAIEVLPEK